MTNRTCTVTGCDNVPRSRTANLCPKHYHRQYRHGDVNFRADRIDTGIKQQRTYRQIVAPNHPLAMKNGRVYEHRAVLYETLGDGTHPCHWCGRPLVWSTKGDPSGIVPDHLNGVEHDNAPSNLVASCARCNSARAQQARSMILRTHGAWSINDTIASLRERPRADVVDPEWNALKQSQTA